MKHRVFCLSKLNLPTFNAQFNDLAMKIILLLVIFLVTIQSYTQDTFSIVAVDTLTGEIGSAGASCIDDNAIAGGAIIISDIIPARGAIHTQSFWISANQQNAHTRMLLGDSPEEIIAWLIANDAQNLPGRRQYGIVDTDESGNPRTAAFTGANCFDWKGHKTGRNYSIQGNILLGEQIITDMENGFLNTEGTLSDKLMAALQGAKVAGADTRCLNEGVSSLSAFIRMARPEDDADSLYLDLNVPETPFGVEPIDELQELYDEWKNLVSLGKQPDRNNISLFYNRETSEVILVPSPAGQSFTWVLYDAMGKAISSSDTRHSRISFSMHHQPSGLYIVKIQYSINQSVSYKFIHP